MSEDHSLDLMWWITVVELPALAGLFWMIWRARRDAEDGIERVRHVAVTAQAQMRESLAAYKLEVAKSYASLGHLKDVEQRLTDHLLRIETKIDNPTAGTRRLGEGGR